MQCQRLTNARGRFREQKQKDMERTIKFVRFQNRIIVCGKNHCGVYGEFQNIAKGQYAIAKIDKQTGEVIKETLNGNIEDVRTYFTELANA